MASLELLKRENYPLICVPITGKTREEILEQLAIIVTKKPDIIEWRADFFHDLKDGAATIALANEIKERSQLPLLFTIRADFEGGEKIALTVTEKVKLLSDICAQTTIDWLDYEIANDTDDVKQIRAISREYGKQFVMSYHNFTETPDEAFLMQQAERAAQLEADIMKFAVMPQTKEDVFRLLEITRKLDEKFTAPIISMAMGELGGLSRIIGWAYGSILTFGVGITSSAPGQMPVDDLRRAITATKKLVPNW